MTDGCLELEYLTMKEQLTTAATKLCGRWAIGVYRNMTKRIGLEKTAGLCFLME